MNKSTRFVIEVPTGIVKMTLLKLLRGKAVSLPFRCAVSPSAEITVDRGAKATIGSDYRQRSCSHVRVRKNGVLSIGNNVSVNHGCMITCHEKVEIGNDVQFSPNVLIYDHDHDYRADGGLKALKFKSSPIKIGDNVWIGANTVILRGSEIGDNVVIGAGSIVKGNIPSGCIFVQKRANTLKSYI